MNAETSEPKEKSKPEVNAADLEKLKKLNEKHLDYLQAIITRHNTNSFTLKGWTITLLAALLALSGAIKEADIALIALMPIIIFWGLDAFYLSNERCFIDLFNAAVKNECRLPNASIFKKDFTDKTDCITLTITPMNMNFKPFKVWKDNTWNEVLWSNTIKWFYIPLLILTLSIWGFQTYNKKDASPIEVKATIAPNQLELKTTPPTIINNIYTNKRDSTRN